MISELNQWMVVVADDADFKWRGGGEETNLPSFTSHRRRNQPLGGRDEKLACILIKVELLHPSPT